MFSGIEAASVAWEKLGWSPAAFAEIEKFPSAVLSYRYPGVKNLGDVTKIDADEISELGKIDLSVFGFPCQDLSTAGKRAGLSNEDGTRTRSGLFYDAARIARLSGSRWVLAENVPGLLSSKRGSDFAAVLAELTGLDVIVPEHGWKNFGIIRTEVPGRLSVCWRVLNAEHFGVPQRRRRVFIVGNSDWRRATEVLFEPESLRGDPKKGKGKRKVVAALTASGVGTCGADDTQAQAGHLIAEKPLAFYGNGSLVDLGEIAPTLRANKDNGNGGPSIFDPYNNVSSPISPALGTGCGDPCGRTIVVGPVVRRLLPVECERLQGFPDGWTMVPWRGRAASLCPDGPRYRAVGNSMAVPVMHWIGARIAQADAI